MGSSTKKSKKDHKKKKSKKQKNNKRSSSTQSSKSKSWSRSRSPLRDQMIPPRPKVPFYKRIEMHKNNKTISIFEIEDPPSPNSYLDKLENLFQQIKKEKIIQDQRQSQQEELSRKQKLQKINEGIQDEIMNRKQQKLKNKQNQDESSDSESDSSSSESYDDEIRKETTRYQRTGSPEQYQSIGPQPLSFDHLNHKISYGSDMFKGEGEAMAQYVESNKRIPRRGEVGLNSDQIEEFENMGYVMSGNRHKKMTAVRIKKESKVYSIQEKKALQIFNYEQKVRRENILVDKFKESLQKKLNNIN